MSPTRGTKLRASRTGKRGRRAAGVRLMSFPLVRGKKIKQVEFSTQAEDHRITLDFDDGTALTFDIRPDPGFTLELDYSDWSSGDGRLIKRWRPVKSQREEM